MSTHSQTYLEPSAPDTGSRTSRLETLASLIHRRRRSVLVAAVVTTLALTALAAGAMSSFVLSRWEAAGTESVRAQTELLDRFDTGNANLILLVTAPRGTVDDPEIAQAAKAVEAELAGEKAVGDVWSYWSAPAPDPTLTSTDRASGLILAHVTGDATSAREAIAGYIPDYTRSSGPIEVRVAGSEAASTQISEQATADFLRAEVIILPLMLILLVVIYRRLSSALLTLGIGLFSVVATLAGLRLLTGAVEIATFAANITLVMGIGLGVDYSLFVISRFREALGRGARVEDALRESLRTSGRTVIFSGATVAAAMAVLLILPFDFLRSFAWAGIFAVLTAGLGALVILPAALAMIGERWARRGVAVPQPAPVEAGRWHRLGSRVMRRPLAWGGVALVLLLALASPALGLRIGVPDERVLPAAHSVRDAYDQLREEFPAEPQDALQILPAAADARATPEEIATYAAELSRHDDIAQVGSPAGTYADGRRIGPADPRLTSTDGDQRIEAVPERTALADGVADDLVGDVRALPSPFGEHLVGGYPTQLVDFRDALVDRLPLIGALLLVVTFVLLFLCSGSLLIPLKATLLNLLSVGVMFGVLTLVFQDGFLDGALGFTPIGTLDPAFPLLMFCVVYGLSMDYEVFMVSRIREVYDQTGDNRTAVLTGLQRSAPLITAAAFTLAVSFAVYATGEVMYLQMVGIGTAIAVLADATIIRGILVPAFMRLAGDANWWLPGPLTRLFGRYRIHDAG
ncbi:MMPL family transporter [Nocardioides sp. NPDC057772]|uniref:MMPL family transporter n=1 Tax=Nocardioides sp. NPDC057772 TaxID=3346245 RepID=UPI00366D1B06